MTGIRAFLALFFWFVLTAPLYAALYEQPNQFRSVSCPGLFYSLSESERTPAILRELPDGSLEAVSLLQSKVEELREPSGKLPEKYFNLEGSCIACSASMQHALAKQGFVSKRWEVSHSIPFTVKGKESLNFTYHYFLTVEPNAKREEIIIDPTYLQFIQEGKRANHPVIFIGTRHELVDFFKRNKESIKRQGGGKSDVEELDPEEFVDLTYGYGPAKLHRKQ